MMEDPYRIKGLDDEIDAEIEECERLEALAETQAAEEAEAELRESYLAEYEITYKQGDREVTISDTEP